MTILNEKEVAAFTFKEAISREKYMTAKLQFYLEITRNSESKHIINSYWLSVKAGSNCYRKK